MLGCEIRLATLSLKLDVLVALLERRYRPDQPRAPKGTPEGGQWIDDLSRVGTVRREVERILVAGLRCDGFSGGCQSGGTFGTTGMVKLFGKNFCMDCAVKALGIQNLPPSQQLEILRLFDKTIR